LLLLALHCAASQPSSESNYSAVLLTFHSCVTWATTRGQAQQQGRPVQAQQHLRRSSSMIERVEYRRKRLAAGVANMQSRARRAALLS
jgi:hypothetical protein